MSTKSKFKAIKISLLHIAFSITYQKLEQRIRSLSEFGLVLYFCIGDGKVYFLIRLK